MTINCVMITLGQVVAYRTFAFPSSISLSEG